MLHRVVPRSRLLTLVDQLGRSRQLIGPVKRGNHCFYEPVNEASLLDLDFAYCVQSPKAFLFPPQETLFSFEKDEGTFRTQPEYDHGPRALVGVHPCDINAMRLLDRVFEDDHRDGHYLHRRANTFVIGIDCATPCTEGVFCRDMMGNSAEEGFDLMCYPLPRSSDAQDLEYGIVFGTRAGRELVLYAQAGVAPEDEHEQALEGYLKDKQDAFPSKIPYQVDTLPELLDRSYDSLLWEATARRCYSCGSCNLTCPTCYCFDAHDELDLALTTGRRVREWDGCQLPGFSVVAGDHNFRPKAASRLRHRIYRKAKWVKEQSGMAGCVGCARCDRACTAKINSVEIYNQLAEES